MRYSIYMNGKLTSDLSLMQEAVEKGCPRRKITLPKAVDFLRSLGVSVTIIQPGD